MYLFIKILSLITFELNGLQVFGASNMSETGKRHNKSLIILWEEFIGLFLFKTALE